MRIFLAKLLLPIIALLAVWQPLYGLYVYLFFNILRPEMFFWGSNQEAAFLKVAILATLLGYFRLPIGKIKPTNCREFWLLLWIFVAVIVSLLLAKKPLPDYAWYFSFELGKLWLVVWMILGIATSKQKIIRLQNVMLLAVTLMSIWGVEQHFRGNERLEGLAGGSVADSNGVAAIGILFLPIAINKWLTMKGLKEKIVTFFASGSIIALIISTQSRGGFIGMVVALVVLLIMTRKKKTLSLLLVAAFLGSSPFISNDYKQRINTIAPDDGSRDYSAESRLVLWQVGLQIFKDNPIFGTGLLTFATEKNHYGQYLSGNFDSGLIEYSLEGDKVGHSTYFGQLLPEGGLFLTLPCFLLFYFSMAGYIQSNQSRKLEQKEKENLGDLLTGIIAGILGHCAALLFINGFLMMFLPVQLVFSTQIIRILKLEMMGKRNECE